MSTPTGLVLAPECRPLTPRRLGSFQITAHIASGRRAEIYLGHREGEPHAPLRLRTPKAGHDVRAFVREVERSIAYGGPGSPVDVEDTDRVTVAWGPPVVGESLAVLLDSIISEKLPMPIDLAITVAMGIAARLGKSPRVHGDLVPHHVIVGYDGSIALLDPAGPDEAAERAAASGRSGYRSPEHVKGEPIGPPADVFVLGALLYELTTGTRLYAGATSRDVDAAIVAGGYPRPRAVLGDHYPIELQVLLRKLLRAQPEGRFPDGEAALEGLRLAASVRSDGQEERVGDWMRARFRARYGAWSSVLSELGVDMGDEPLDFDGDPTESPDLLDLSDLAGLTPPPPSSNVPWPVWSPPAAPSPIPAHPRSSTLPSARPAAASLADLAAAASADEAADLDEQTRPVNRGETAAIPADRLLTALELRIDARVDATDPFGRAVDDGDGQTLDEGAAAPPRPSPRSLAASRERTVISAPPSDPDEQTWNEPSPPVPERAADREDTRPKAASVAWDLELPEDVDPEQTSEEGDIPALLDEADIQLLSGSEADTPLPRGAVPADLASDLLGEDFREHERELDRKTERAQLDERAVPEPRKVRQRLDSTLADPSAAPTQVGAAATPMPAPPEPASTRKAPTPTALLEGLAPPPVRPAPAPPRREETVIVRQRNVPRDAVQELDPDALVPESTLPLVPAMAHEVSDADSEGLLVIPVADDEGARKKPRLVMWLGLGAALLLGLAVAAWSMLAGAPSPPPAPTVRAVPVPVPAPTLPPAVVPAPTSTVPTRSATAAVVIEPEPDEPRPSVDAPAPSRAPGPEGDAVPPGPPDPDDDPPLPRATPPAADAPAAPESAAPPSASALPAPAATSPRASATPAPRPTATPPAKKRPAAPPVAPAPPPPKGPVDIKVTAFPATATLRVEGQELPSGSKITVGKEPVVVTVTAEGYQEQMVEIRQTSPKEVSILLRRKK